MVFHMTSATAALIAAAVLAPALAACGETGEPTSFGSTAANGLIRVGGDCVYAPQAGAAAANAGFNVAEAPQGVRIAVEGTGSNLNCPVENLLPEGRGEERPPRTTGRAPKPGWLVLIGRVARRIPLR